MKHSHYKLLSCCHIQCKFLNKQISRWCNYFGFIILSNVGSFLESPCIIAAIAQSNSSYYRDMLPMQISPEKMLVYFICVQYADAYNTVYAYRILVSFCTNVKDQKQYTHFSQKIRFSAPWNHREFLKNLSLFKIFSTI